MAIVLPLKVEQTDSGDWIVSGDGHTIAEVHMLMACFELVEIVNAAYPSRRGGRTVAEEPTIARNKTLGGYLYQPEYRRWVDAWHRVFDYTLHPGMSIEDNFRQLRKLLLVEGFEVGANHAKEACRAIERAYRPGGDRTCLANAANEAIHALVDAHNVMESMQPIDLVAEYLDMGDQGEAK